MKKKTCIFIIIGVLLLIAVILFALLSPTHFVKKVEGSIPYNESNSYMLYNGYNLMEFTENGMITQYSISNENKKTVISKKGSFHIDLPIKKYISWNLFITKNDEIMFGDIKGTEHKKLGTFQNAADISVTKKHESDLVCATVVTSDGLLFVQGDNSTGALGIETKQVNGEFVQVPYLQNVTKAICGINCIFVLNTDGEVFLSGTLGELSYKTFTKLEVPEKVKDISGSLTSGTFIALGVDGNVYEMGVSYFQNIYYNEDTPHTGLFYSSFQKISRLKNIASVIVDGTIAYAIDNDGKVFYWGSEMKGGRSSELKKVFKRICGIPKPDNIWRGDCLFVLSDGEITAYDW